MFASYLVSIPKEPFGPFCPNGSFEISVESDANRYFRINIIPISMKVQAELPYFLPTLSPFLHSYP